MFVLLVNDDGKDSERLLFAREVLQKHGEVVTVAPLHEQSGKGMAISTGDLPYEKITDDFYAVDGTPVDCVNFALFGLNLRPDYIVSGVNRGYNLGIDTMYSGTVGAALQGYHHGYRALAFSGDYKGDKQVRKLFEKTFLQLVDEGMPSPDYTLNVNFPREDVHRLKGIKMTKRYFGKQDAQGRLTLGHFKITRERRPNPLDEAYDVQAVRDGYVSVSKIAFKD